MTGQNKSTRRLSFPLARSSWTAALVVLLIGSIVAWHSVNRYEEHLYFEKRQGATTQLTLVGNSLTAVIHDRLKMLEGLRVFTSQSLSSTESYFDKAFESLATSLYLSESGVRNFSVAPKGVQTYVYPTLGNEKVSGHDLFKDQRQAVQASIKKAMTTGEATLSPPYELRQGGLGMVARQAIYHEEHFWGFVAIVLDMPVVLEEAGLSKKGSPLIYVLQNQSGEVFFGEKEALAKAPVNYQVLLPGVQWQLSALPVDGWHISAKKTSFAKSLAIFLPIILAALTYLLVDRQKNLTQMVDQRTAELNTVFEAADNVAFITTDLGGEDTKIISFSPGAEKIFGYSEEEALGQKISILHPEGAAKEFAEMQQALRDGKKGHSGESVLVRKSGVHFSALFTLHPLFNDTGTLRGTLGVSIDITARKQAEAIRNRLNAQLDQKNKELEQVVYVTSHDLRSPLVSIEGFSGMLTGTLDDLLSHVEQGEFSAKEQKRIEELTAECRESVEYIRGGVSSMSSLLTGLLQFSRLGRIEITRERVDMNALLANVLGDFKIQLDQKKIKAEVEPLPACFGDKIQLHQLFNNLISNAIKYTGSQRPGRIRISGNIKDGQSVYCVEDNGIGIAKEFQGKIFEIFHQLNPGAGGDGLGLSIIQRIVERHKGQIRIESEPDEGSRFYISL